MFDEIVLYTFSLSAPSIWCIGGCCVDESGGGWSCIPATSDGGGGGNASVSTSSIWGNGSSCGNSVGDCGGEWFFTAFTDGGGGGSTSVSSSTIRDNGSSCFGEWFTAATGGGGGGNSSVYTSLIWGNGSSCVNSVGDCGGEWFFTADFIFGGFDSDMIDWFVFVSRSDDGRSAFKSDVGGDDDGNWFLAASVGGFVFGLGAVVGGELELAGFIFGGGGGGRPDSKCKVRY